VYCGGRDRDELSFNSTSVDESKDMKIATYSGIKRKNKPNKRGPGKAIGSMTHRGMRKGFSKQKHREAMRRGR
jgi:hypothetical protein